MTSEEIMGENKSFWQVVVDCLKNLLIKAISFKNIGFGIGCWLGVKMAIMRAASFTEWAAFMLILLVVFFTANQFQKWLFGALINRRGGDPE